MMGRLDTSQKWNWGLSAWCEQPAYWTHEIKKERIWLIFEAKMIADTPATPNSK